METAVKPQPDVAGLPEPNRRLTEPLEGILWLVLAFVAGQSAARACYAATVVGHAVSISTFVIDDVLASLVPLALIACGLFTVARIMRAGTRMHDDLAGTV